MLSILNFGSQTTTQKLTAQENNPSPLIAETGAGAGFAAVLAQVMSADDPAPESANGKLTKLAEMLGDFRLQAQQSLSEAFPDGVIQPGSALNDWAKAMLTKLDGLLQQSGASLADLGKLLGPLDGAMFGGAGLEDAGSLLTKAAQTLLTGEPATAQGSESGVETALDGLAGQMGDDLSEAIPSLRAALAKVAGETEAMTDPVKDVKTQIAANIVKASATGEQGDLTQGAPLPDALRILLVQAVAAPGDRALPPEVQAILSAPQPTAAPLIASVAQTAPPPPQANTPTPEQGLARNLAGQIRGVSFSEGTTRIELSPHGLGSIEIEISPDEAGKLRVVLRAENPAVLNAMRSDREMLAGLLRDGGSSVEENAMSFENFGQQRQATRQNDSSGVADAPLGAEDEDTETVPIEAQTTISADGRLNILT